MSIELRIRNLKKEVLVCDNQVNEILSNNFENSPLLKEGRGYKTKVEEPTGGNFFEDKSKFIKLLSEEAGKCSVYLETIKEEQKTMSIYNTISTINSELLICDRKTDLAIKSRAQFNNNIEEIFTRFKIFNYAVNIEAIKLIYTKSKYLSPQNFVKSINANKDIHTSLTDFSVNETAGFHLVKNYTTTIKVPDGVTGRFAISSYTVGTLEDNNKLCNSDLQTQTEESQKEQQKMFSLIVEGTKCMNAIPSAIASLFECQTIRSSEFNTLSRDLSVECGTLETNLSGPCGAFLKLSGIAISEPNFSGDWICGPYSQLC
jgi:hypothetical protein